MNTSRLAVACLVAFALTACSNSGTGGGGGVGGSGAGGGSAGGGTGGAGGSSVLPDGGGTPQSAFCTAYSNEYCDRDQACLFLDPAQRADCIARATAQCATAVARITAGVRGYDPGLGLACINAVKADPCSAGRNIFAGGLLFTYPCLANLGPGASPPGSVCFSTADCASGYCAGGAPQCSACRAFVATGGACDTTTSFCNTTTHACRTQSDGGRACALYGNIGDPCVLSSNCHPTTTAGCAPGNADGRLIDGGQRTCRDFLPDGTPCSSNPPCQSKHCNANSEIPDAGPNVCGHRALGQLCGDEFDCDTAYCKGLDRAGAVTIPGTCTLRIAAGGACVTEPEDFNGGCVATHTCIGGLCKVPGMQLLNEPCSFSTECLATLYCEPGADGGNGTCLARVANGSACSTTATGPNPLCLADSTCTASVCVAPAALGSAGASCTTNTHCKDLLHCAPNPGDAGTCANYAMAGANCDAGAIVCASGNSSLGFCAVIDAGPGPALRTCSNALGNGTPCSNTPAGQCTSGRCLGADGGNPSALNPGICQASCIP